MITFTLDTNCLIELKENRVYCSDVRFLANAHADGIADVAVVAISASEKKISGEFSNNFSEFKDQLELLSLGHLKIISPMAYWDITYFDNCLLADSEMINLEKDIHKILFPNIAYDFDDYYQEKKKEINYDACLRKWRNCKCDVQAIWSHIYHNRNIFVTIDQNFHKSKKEKLINLGAGRIEFPKGARLMIEDAGYQSSP